MHLHFKKSLFKRILHIQAENYIHKVSELIRTLICTYYNAVYQKETKQMTLEIKIFKSFYSIVMLFLFFQQFFIYTYINLRSINFIGYFCLLPVLCYVLVNNITRFSCLTKLYWATVTFSITMSHWSQCCVMSATAL